ncbi:MAG: hypothetical protein GY861_04165 [bacterium]|nr:hypothetical protein [bacterium]
MTKDEQHAAKKAKTHTIYKTQAGKRVPGTTTITGVMDKPALKYWANGLGLKGIEVRTYVDELALIGTLAHYMIECHCKGIEPDLDDYSKNQIDLAENSAIKFIQWQDDVGFVPEHNELKLVSETHKFGGTLDIIGTIKGKKVLVDIKTCKGIYGEHKTQVAGGYGILANENGYKVEEVIIIRVGRNADEGFEQINISPEECDAHEQRFLVCRELYEMNKKINKFK